uniref:BZIP domain-containing protein n=1 Tax=Leersia perrieri TaxID=77586 RepID=A0A0D9W2D3_9ORYZ
MKGKSLHGLSLLDGSDDGILAPMVPSQLSSILNLVSHHRLNQSFHVSPARFTSLTGSAFSRYLEPPRLAPAVEVGNSFRSEQFFSLFPNSSFLKESIRSPPYVTVDVPPMIALVPQPTRSNQGLRSKLPLMVGHRRWHREILLEDSLQSLQMPHLAPVKPEDRGRSTCTQRGTHDTVMTLSCVGHWVIFVLDSTLPADVVDGVMKDLGIIASTSNNVTQDWHEKIHSDPQAWGPSDSRENEAQSSDASNTTHYCCNMSLDTFMTRTLNVGVVNLQMCNPLLPNTVAYAGGSESNVGGIVVPFATEFGNVKFHEEEKKKIMADKFLSEIVLADPKRVKRILNNRASAARSKLNKMKYTTELERKVQVLQRENATLCVQVTLMQKNNQGLLSQNNEMKIRLQTMDQQAQSGNALTEILTTEVEQLKVIAGEISSPDVPRGSYQPVISISSPPSQNPSHHFLPLLEPNIKGESSRCHSLLDGLGDGIQAPTVPSHVSSIVNLISHYRINQSSHPSPIHFTSLTGSLFSLLGTTTVGSYGNPSFRLNKLLVTTVDFTK